MSQGSSTSASSSAARLQLPENSRIVSASYLEKKTSKKDLIRRLRNLFKVLQSETIELDNLAEWPGLHSVSDALIPLWTDSEKDVRLHAVLCGMEVLGLWAPDVPWEVAALKTFFRSVIAQLGNLAHCTDDDNDNNGSHKNNNHYTHYTYMLDTLCETRMAVILVELCNDDGDDDNKEEALEILVDFIHILLNCLRHDHSTDLMDRVRSIIGGCVEEFGNNGATIPVAILDELLKALVHGPHVWILADHAGPTRSKKHGGLPKVSVRNTTYLAAAAVLRTLLNKLAQPVSELLNGILNAQDYYLEHSTIRGEGPHADIYQIVFELHRVAPQILITVLGTVSHGLTSEDDAVRLETTRLLGKLFCHGDWAVQYSSCFRQWLSRRVDKQVPIRLLIVEHCLALVDSQEGAVDTLVQLCTSDVSVEVRQRCIRGICDGAYSHTLPVRLLRAVGERVTSKQREERLDAVTGLSHVYAKQWLLPALRTERVVEAVHRLLDDAVDDGLYGWIPSVVLEAVTIPDMRARVLHILDEGLVPAKLDESGRAAAWVVIFQHLHDSEWFGTLLRQRACLQTLLSTYLDARSKRSNINDKTSEAYLAADALAVEKLEGVAKLVGNPTILDLHSVRNKHVFRILGMLTTSAHSTQARKRALEELPKHTTGALSKYLPDFVQFCAMGDMLNRDTMQKCAELANEAFEEGDYQVLHSVVSAMQTALDIFPEMGQQALKSLMELFSECRTAPSSNKKELRETVTVLSSILSKVPHPKKQEMDFDASDLQAQLESLCTKDGTPEQARNAVYALLRLHGPDAIDRFAPLVETLTSASKLRISSDKKDSVTVVTYLAALTALADCAPSVMSASPRAKRAIQFALEKILLGRDGDSKDDSESDEDADAEVETPAKSRSRKKHSTPKTKGSILEDSTLSVSCRRLCAAMDFLASFIRSSKMAILSNKDTSKVTTLPDNQIRTFLELLTQIITDNGLPLSRADRKHCQSRQDRAALRQSAGVSLVRLCDPRLELEKEFMTHSMWHTLGDVIVDEERAVRDAMVAEMSVFLQGLGIYGIEKTPFKAKPPSLRFLALLTLCSDRDHESTNIHTNSGKSALSFQKAAQNCIVNLRKISQETYTRCCAAGKDAEQRFENVYKMLIMPEYTVPYALHLLSHRRETPSDPDNSDESEAHDEEDDCSMSCGNQHVLLRKRLKFLFEPLVESLGDQADNISFLLQMTDVLGQKYEPIDVSPMVLALSSPEKRLSASPGSNENATPNFAKKRAGLLRRKLKLVCSEARQVLLDVFVKKDANLATYPGQMQLPRTLYKLKETVRGSLDSTSTDASKKCAASPPKKRSPPPAKKVSPPPSRSALKRHSEQRVDAVSPSKTSKVHFSPETKAIGKSSPRLSSQSKSPKVSSHQTGHKTSFQKKSPNTSSSGDEESFKLSPIAKSPIAMNVPMSATKSSEDDNSAATMGSSPPPMLHTMRSTAPDEDSADDSSIHLLPSTQESPVVDRRRSPRPSQHSQSSDDVPSSKSTTQSTAETGPSRQSPGSASTHRSTPSSGTKRRRFVGDLSQSSKKKKRAKKSNPPSSISVTKESQQLQRSKATKRSKKAVDEFEFDSGGDADEENVHSNKTKKKTTTAQASKKKGTTPAASARPRKATRGRHGVA